MRVTKGLRINEKTIILLLGDGVREERLVRAISEKYNHKKTLLIPTIGYGKVGLTGVIERLSLLTLLTRVNRYAIVIDKEHVESIDEVMSKLKEYGFTINTIINLDKDLWEIKCTKGPKDITIIFMAVGLTAKGRIEENIAKLIRLFYGEEVNPDKVAINTWLRRHNLRDHELIRETLERSKEKFRKAFPNLMTFIEYLAKDPP